MFAQVFDLLYQWVEDSLRIANDNRFVVVAEHFGGEGVEEFVDGAYASGKGNDDVAFVDEPLFAFAHAFGGNQFGGLAARPSQMGDVPGNDTENGASVFAGVFRDDFHETAVGTSVNQSVMVLSYPLPQYFTFGFIDWVDIVCCGTKYSNALHSFSNFFQR